MIEVAVSNCDKEDKCINLINIWIRMIYEIGGLDKHYSEFFDFFYRIATLGHGSYMMKQKIVGRLIIFLFQ